MFLAHFFRFKSKQEENDKKLQSTGQNDTENQEFVT